MMKPTVGRIVYYSDNGEIRTAIVAKVNTDTVLNLMVVHSNGRVSGVLDVVQGDSHGQWDWMPYQKAKAASGDVNSESAEPRP